MSAESIEKQDVDMEEPKEVKEKVEEEVLVLNGMYISLCLSLCRR